jgi:hypothetical protein
VPSAFLASEMCELERVTYQKSAKCAGRDGREGKEGPNLTVSLLFLPSLSGPRAGLCYQGHGPKTVEATIHILQEYKV